MKNYFTLLLFTFLCNYCFSQNDLNQGFDTYGRDNPFIAIKYENDNSIQGSKYFDDNYLSAKISNYPNQIFGLRYNLFTDEMEFKNKEGKVFTLKKSNEDFSITFVNENLTYKLFDYNKKNKIVKGYFVVLSNGKTQLLKQQKVIFLKEQKSNSGYENHKPAEYKRIADTYYMKINNSSVVIQVPKNKKKFAELFPNYKSEILKYIKSNKLKTTNEADLIKIISFIYSD